MSSVIKGLCALVLVGSCAGSNDYPSVDAVSHEALVFHDTGSFDGIPDGGGADVAPRDLPPSGDKGTAQTWKHGWSKIFGGSGPDSGWSVAVTPTGGVVVVGKFSGIVSFGGGPLTALGSSDIFVAAFDKAGKPLWSTSFGGTGEDKANAVAVDSNGALTVTGAFTGTAHFGNLTLVGHSDLDLFVLRLSSAGKPLWVKGFGGVGDDAGWVVKTWGGDVYVTGIFSKTIDFGWGGQFSAQGEADGFVARFGSSGSVSWAGRYGGLGRDVVRRLVVDAAGNFVICGSFTQSITLGGKVHQSAGDADLFVVKSSAAGQVQWSQRIGGIENDGIRGMTIDQTGNVTLIGKFSNVVTLGTTTLASMGLVDIFIVSYSPSGKLRWASSFGGSGADVGRSVAALEDGSIAYTGLYSASVDFGAGLVPTKGSSDVVLGHLSSTGAKLGGAIVFGSVGSDFSSDLVAGPGRLYVTGSSGGAVDFGGGSIAGFGDTDAFLVAFDR